MDCIFVRKIKIVFILASLCGCATSSISDDPPAPTFEELKAELTEVAGDMNAIQSQGQTPVAAFTNGTATYSGFVTHTKGGSILPPIDPTETVIGELTVASDFNTDDISVEIFNLASDTRGSISGSINGEGMIVDMPSGVAANFSFDVAGALQINGNGAEYQGALQGTFYGTSPDLVFVDIIGAVEFDAGGIEEFDMTGYALAD